MPESRETSPLLPNRIRELRRDRGLTQAEVAHRMGTATSQLSVLERGKRRLSLPWMQRIARALEVYPAELLPLDEQSHELSDEERRLIRDYRAQSPEQREMFWLVVDSIVNRRSHDEEELIDRFRTGTDEQRFQVLQMCKILIP